MYVSTGTFTLYIFMHICNNKIGDVGEDDTIIFNDFANVLLMCCFCVANVLLMCC